MNKLPFVIAQLFLALLIVILSDAAFAETTCQGWDGDGNCVNYLVTAQRLSNPDKGEGGLTAGGRLPSGGGGTSGSRPTWQGSLCRASLAALGTVSCGLVVAACATGTFVTIGTLAVPCVGISVVSCSILGAGALIGGEQLCKP